MAKSLMEGMDTPSPSRPAKKREGGKLILALALLAVALGVFAYTQGWLGTRKPPPDMTVEERAAQDKTFQEQQKRTQEMINKGTAKTGGTS